MTTLLTLSLMKLLIPVLHVLLLQCSSLVTQLAPAKVGVTTELLYSSIVLDPSFVYFFILGQGPATLRRNLSNDTVNHVSEVRVWMANQYKFTSPERDG